MIVFQISPTWCGRKTSLMRFQSENAVFKFIQRSVGGAFKLHVWLLVID